MESSLFQRNFGEKNSEHWVIDPSDPEFLLHRRVTGHQLAYNPVPTLDSLIRRIFFYIKKKILNTHKDRTICKLMYELNHDYLQGVLKDCFKNNDCKKFATLLSNYADKSKAPTEGKKVIFKLNAVVNQIAYKWQMDQ